MLVNCHEHSIKHLCLSLCSPLGSIYEKCGHECCLSTGDVIKVVGLKVKKVLASNCESEDDASFCSTTVELPLHFPGTVWIFSG